MYTHAEILNNSMIHGKNNFTGEIIPDNFKILMSKTRDSEILTQSNWIEALKRLGGESEDVRIDNFGSWACGWFEYLSINENSEKYKIALQIEQELEDYPVLNEDDLWQREDSESIRIWKECYTIKERIAYIRENRNQFDFNDFSMLRAVINGEYFIGDASGLLY